MLRYCYNIVRNPLFIVLMKFPSSATAGLRPVQPLRCCFLASSSLPAVLEGYPSIPWQSVMSVMASEGSNAVFSYQAARRPVQRDRPQRPALGRPAIVHGKPWAPADVRDVDGIAPASHHDVDGVCGGTRLFRCRLPQRENN